MPKFALVLIVTSAAVTLTRTADAADLNALDRALESISKSQLQDHVDLLADDAFEGREAGTRGGRAAATYLVKQLEKIGIPGGAGDGRYHQPFGRGYRNVLGRIEGSDPERNDEWIVVGAHYDHVGYGMNRNSNGAVGTIHNGADDNASGIAGLLEVAEALAGLPRPPPRSILLAFWDGEEKGLLGSRHWMSSPTVPLNHVIHSVNLDMIGRLGPEGIEIAGTRSSYRMRQFISRSNHHLDRLDLRFPWRLPRNSDHYPFYEGGIPVVMFHTGLHADYHRPSDDAHLINTEGIRQISRLVFHTVHDLTERPGRPSFRTASRYEGSADQRRFERPLPAPTARLGITWDAENSVSRGILLTSVVAGSAADRAGLVRGDRLLRFNGLDVDEVDRFRRQVISAGTSSQVLVHRADHQEPVSLDLVLSGRPMRVGISWREDDAEPRSVTLVRVVRFSAAHQAGLLPGDRIYEIGGREFADQGEFAELCSTLPSPLVMLVERRGRFHSAQLEVPPAAERE